MSLGRFNPSVVRATRTSSNKPIEFSKEVGGNGWTEIIIPDGHQMFVKVTLRRSHSGSRQRIFFNGIIIS